MVRATICVITVSACGAKRIEELAGLIFESVVTDIGSTRLLGWGILQENKVG